MTLSPESVELVQLAAAAADAKGGTDLVAFDVTSAEALDGG